MPEDKAALLILVVVNDRSLESVAALRVQHDPDPVNFVVTLEGMGIIRERHAEPRTPTSVQEADLDPQIRPPLPPSLFLEHRSGVGCEFNHASTVVFQDGDYTMSASAEPMKERFRATRRQAAQQERAEF